MALVPNLDTYINGGYNILLSGKHGIGKGLTLETPVITPDGSRPIGDLRVGDSVIGSNGKPTVVVEIFDRGVQEIFEVEFSDGAKVTCDGDHLWEVWSSKQHFSNGPTVTKSVSELLQEGVRRDRSNPNHSPHYKWFVPIVSPVQHTGFSPIGISPYLMGVYLANGAFTNSTIDFTTNDFEIIEKIEGLGYEVTEHTYTNSTARRWQVVGLQPYLRSPTLGLKGKLSAGKFIQKEYLYATESERMDLLAGLLDCDGSACGNHKPQFHTTSPQLRDDVVQLVNSLGGTTTLLEDDRVGKNVCYRVSIALPYNPFYLQSKRRNNTWAGSVFRAISSITQAGEAETRCIKVDAEDKLFVTRNYLVTHNTEILKDAASRLGLKVKYYSCSTLDPFTDLVGIPYPTDDPVTGEKILKMIRPHDLDQADILFFDELNRAQDSKTQNAIFEIIQFGSINGEKLPNLKGCWAAVNPADDSSGYMVHDLDPALVDRFDLFFEIKPQVSVPYLAQTIDKKVAGALKAWWDDSQKRGEAEYISPRRIHKIGMMIQSTQDVSVVRHMLPPGGKFATGDLIAKLKIALGQGSGSVGANGPADSRIIYTKKGLRENTAAVALILNDPNVSTETFRKVIDVIQDGVGVGALVELGPIIQSLPRAMFEGVFNAWAPAKRSQFKASWSDAYDIGKVAERDLFSSSKAAFPMSRNAALRRL